MIHVHYAPHEKLPVHDHSPFPTVYVYLSDSGPVRFSHVEKVPFAIVRKPLRAGAFRVSPGRIERHEVENLGDVPTDFLRVELKRVPLGLDALAYRSGQSFDSTLPGIRSEFTSPQFSIERIVSTGAAQQLPGDTPSLLIAISDLRLNAQVVRSGATMWLQSGARAVLGGTAEHPAHGLRICFPVKR